MDKQQKTVITYTVVILTAVGGLILISTFNKGVRGLFQKLGLIESDEETKQKRETSKAKQDLFEWFNPNKYSSFKGKQVQLLKTSDLKDIAEQIYDSGGIIINNASKALAAFKRLKYKTQVSYLANYFNNKYKRDLLTYITSFFNNDSNRSILNDIFKHIDSLPTGVSEIKK